ncbi:MAG: hypothetical protein P8N49_05675 [Opitutales bacterium]|nr:hypothetical protein [Opitutales bacterium]
MIRYTFKSLTLCICLVYTSMAVPVKKEGRSMGILVAKGEAWVDLKEDNGFQHRYLVPWTGGAPSKGGRFDAQMLDLIAATVVGNRVEVKWKFDGHLRLVDIAVIVPVEKEGVFVGSLIEIGDHWVDFQNPDDRIPWRFYLRWVGGYPENGGGYDGHSREELIAQKQEPLFRFHWTYDTRPRFEGLLRLEDYQEPLFYQGKKEEPAPVGEPQVPSTPGINPFDTQPAPKVNPFDMKGAPVGNPFDQSDPPAQINPFDISNAPQGNPFEQAAPVVSPPPSGNPFEQAAPASIVNPFDLEPMPKDKPEKPAANGDNPFDLIGK